MTSTLQASATVRDTTADETRPHPAAMGGERRRQLAADTATHVFLGVLAVFWLIPLVWILMESFNKNSLPFTTTFFPTQYTLSNYVKLFTDTSVMNFPRMFLRTLVIAIFVCAIQLVFVLSVGFVMSRLRFRTRRPFMNGALVLGMFPGIMAVVAIYFILKAMGLTGSSTGTMVGLILVYSAGSGAGFYVMKGFMDTIPVSMDEAAVLDGCTRWQVFTRIILPITKPMMVYQAIVGFLTPWLDFVLAKVIARTQDNYTVSLGLWQMLQKEYIAEWYTRFAAGAVLISIPIAVLFIVMQRFYQSSMTGSVKG